ncbi:hypothetical protein ACFVQB_06915 [Paenibacillus sp. NPDC057886]|uniref:hypothetical protein n=1 Tax=Paenibacillus sp. NPDC057886 TaxID=3346270 RepID=UPI003681B631
MVEKRERRNLLTSEEIVMINSNVIDEFRKQVNANSNFTLDAYRKKDGINYWNIICACMDWIDVGVEAMEKFSFDRKLGPIGLEVFTYISAIDIVWESIKQLHRTIINVAEVPFSGEKDVFIDDNLHTDDNAYFKHIRAVFGAHPVNLSDSAGAGHYRRPGAPQQAKLCATVCTQTLLYSYSASCGQS